VTFLQRWRRWSRRELIAGVIVLTGLMAFIVVTYGVVVLGGGALFDATASTDVALSVVATAVVALAFDPLQTRLEAVASRAVHGGQTSPFEVLRRFSETVTGTYAAEELPARMARVLADGTGAAWSQVWIVVDGRPTLAASWPPQLVAEMVGPEAPSPDHQAPGRRTLPVRPDRELLGHLVVQEREGVSLSPVEERLFAELAAHAGHVLRGASLRADLERRLTQLSAVADELRVSRQRLVDVHDHKRRLLERDIHDGAQQHLVALAVNLRLAQTVSQKSASRAMDLLRKQQEAARTCIENLDELTNGIYPPFLEGDGLGLALEAAAATSPIAVTVTAERIGRYPRSVEAAAYFCCLEALQNAVKHSHASNIAIVLLDEPGALSIAVEDDGIGFEADRTGSGAGLANMNDRISALGGSLTVAASASGGARISALLPSGGRVVTAAGSR
jgi:signal transduction histidine kinase